MKNKNLKILLMGPCSNKNRPEITGGAIVLFNELLKDLGSNGIDYLLIDTNKNNYNNILSAYILIIKQLFILQKSSTHISLHSSRDYIYLGLFLVFIGKLFSKKTSLRKFGGEAIQKYTASYKIKKYYLKFIFSKIDVLFFETKYLVEFFSKINENTHWFPNVRKRPVGHLKVHKDYQKRFVFMSHVIPEKGIDEIIDANALLDDNFRIDIYGPILDKKYSKEYFLKNGVSYMGAVQPSEVIQTLNKYDVLILPSYKEGYPGIIIEAFSLGIPVITTQLLAIREIVDSYKTGILIEPKNVEELVSAIKYFDNKNYLKMSDNAYEKFDDFDSAKQTSNFLGKL